MVQGSEADGRCWQVLTSVVWKAGLRSVSAHAACAIHALTSRINAGTPCGIVGARIVGPCVVGPRAVGAERQLLALCYMIYDAHLGRIISAASNGGCI